MPVKPVTKEDILKDHFERKLTGYSYDNVISVPGFSQYVLKSAIDAMTEYAALQTGERDERIKELEKENEELKESARKN